MPGSQENKRRQTADSATTNDDDDDVKCYQHTASSATQTAPTNSKKKHDRHQWRSSHVDLSLLTALPMMINNLFCCCVYHVCVYCCCCTAFFFVVVFRFPLTYVFLLLSAAAVFLFSSLLPYSLIRSVISPIKQRMLQPLGMVIKPKPSGTKRGVRGR